MVPCAIRQLLTIPYTGFGHRKRQNHTLFEWSLSIGMYTVYLYSYECHFEGLILLEIASGQKYDYALYDVCSVLLAMV